MANEAVKYDEQGRALANPAFAGLPQSRISKEKFEEVVTSFFPVLSLAQALSVAVTDRKGVEPGDLYLRKGSSIVNLGTRCIVTPVASKFTAIDSNDPKVFCYDTEDPEFKRIQAESNQSQSGCFWGPEFLVWVKDHGFASLLCGSKTLRRVSGQIDAMFQNTIALTSEDVQGGKNKWKGLAVDSVDFDSTVPISEVPAAVEKFNLIPGEDLDEAIKNDTTGASNRD